MLIVDGDLATYLYLNGFRVDLTAHMGSIDTDAIEEGDTA